MHGRSANGRWGIEREGFWDTLNARMIADARGARGTALSICNGNRKLAQRVDNSSRLGTRQGRGRYDANVRTYREYAFVVAMEHARSDVGYITEKVVDALLAGAVPIYAGATDAQIAAVLDARSFVHMRRGEDDATARDVVDLLRNTSRYDAIRRHPAVSADSMRKFFSWHPEVWPVFGDHMRRYILAAVTGHCTR